jgi:hypothetical protein
VSENKTKQNGKLSKKSTKTETKVNVMTKKNKSGWGPFLNE